MLQSFILLLDQCYAVFAYFLVMREFYAAITHSLVRKIILCFNYIFSC